MSHRVVSSNTSDTRQANNQSSQSPPNVTHHNDNPPTTQRCGCLCKCIRIMWIIFRTACCCCGICCTSFWLILLYSLIILTSNINNIDFATTNDTCYHKLEVTPDATTREIQKSFRKLALKYHPDKAPANKREEYQTIFQEISHCYDILSNNKTRARYNQWGYKEENNFGIPFDVNIDIDDILNFFKTQFNNNNNNNENDNNNNNEFGFKKRKKSSQKRKKTRKNQKILRDYTINLLLEDILTSHMHEIVVDNSVYFIEIEGGIPNGYIISDSLNGFNWKINVSLWDKNRLWNRKNDNDYNLYSYITISAQDILMESNYNRDLLMIDGSKQTINIQKICKNKHYKIKNNGLPIFKSKKTGKNRKIARGSAIIECDILYPKLTEKQKKKLKKSINSDGGEWLYNNDNNHNEL